MGALNVGIIITRCDELDEIFKDLKIYTKYGFNDFLIAAGYKYKIILKYLLPYFTKIFFPKIVPANPLIIIKKISKKGVFWCIL